MRFVLLVASLLVVSACASMSAGSTSGPADIARTLRPMEEGKWHPASLGGVDKLRELFADDFVTVEYGPDVNGAVYRSEGAKKSLEGPLVEMLNKMSFTLSEWRWMRLSDDAVLVSYRVTEPTLRWTAYATSVWVRRGGKWETVFYQASKARPAQ